MNNPNETDEVRISNPKIEKNYNSMSNQIKKSKSISQLVKIKKKNSEKQLPIVKNQKVIKNEEENIYTMLNLNKDDDYPHLRNLSKRNKEDSLNPVSRNQPKAEIEEPKSRGN
jgi:hypothetical protein